MNTLPTPTPTPTRSHNPAHARSAKIVVDCVTECSAIFNRSVEHAGAQLWLTKLARFDAELIKEAFDDWIEHETRFPCIANILELIALRTTGGVNAKWIQAYKVAQQADCTWSHYVVFDEAATHFAISAVGGMSHLRERASDASTFSYAQRDFCKAFLEYRPGLPYPSGFGTFNGANAVLIGKPALALAVYAAGKSSDHDQIQGLGMLQQCHCIAIGRREMPPRLLAQHLLLAPAPPPQDVYP